MSTEGYNIIYIGFLSKKKMHNLKIRNFRQIPTGEKSAKELIWPHQGKAEELVYVNEN